MRRFWIYNSRSMSALRPKTEKTPISAIADFLTDPDDKGQSVICREGRLIGARIRYDPKVYSVTPLFEDEHSDSWPSGTASYLMSPEREARDENRLLVLKITDLSALKNETDFNKVREAAQLGDRRIEGELYTMERLEEVREHGVDVPVPKFIRTNSKKGGLWLRLQWGDQEDKTVAVRCILRQSVPALTMRDWFQSKHSPEKFRGVHNLHTWFLMCTRLASRLEILHRERVVHGYISPDTILVQEGAPFPNPRQEELLFMNTEETTVPAEAEGSPAPIRRFYDAPEKWSALTNGEPVDLSAPGEWYPPADIFSLGMTFLYLAVGDPPIDICPFDLVKSADGHPGWLEIENYGRLKNSADLRKLVVDALLVRQRAQPFLVDGLEAKDSARQLDIAIRISSVVMNCIEPDAGKRAQSLRSVIGLLRMFTPPGERRRSPATIQAVTKAWSSVIAPARNLKKGSLNSMIDVDSRDFELPPLPRAVSAILMNRMRLLMSDFRQAGVLGDEFSSLRITGARNTLIETMLVVLSCLSQDDECDAILTPAFWLPENMGPTGRVLRMLELAALSGAKIRWMTVLNHRRLSDRQIEKILNAQADVSTELKTVEKPRKGTAEEDSVDPLNYAVADNEAYHGLLRDKLTHIRLRFKNSSGSSFIIAPDYGGAKGQKLLTLRFWSAPNDLRESISPGRQEVLTEVFKKFWSMRRPLRNFKR
jgi:hypothetical protein